MAALRGDGVAAVCSIVGDGPEYADLRQLAARHPEWLTAPGHVEQPERRVLPLLDVLVLPSECEGHPMVLLEAMASGVACICSDVGGCAETIRHGRDGFILRQNTPAQIARHLNRIIVEDGLWARLSRSCAARHAEMFTAARMTACWEQLYREGERSREGRVEGGKPAGSNRSDDGEGFRRRSDVRARCFPLVPIMTFRLPHSGHRAGRLKMRVAVVLEQRFRRTPEGYVWTDGPGGYSFWTRYLAAFEEVRVVVRVLAAAGVQPGWTRADGPRVTFAPVPHYLGPGEYLRKARAVRRAVRQSIDPADAVILRVPSNLAGLLFPLLRRSGHPYAVEVLGDPYDVFAPGAVRHPLRRWFRAASHGPCGCIAGTPAPRPT